MYIYGVYVCEVFVGRGPDTTSLNAMGTFLSVGLTEHMRGLVKMVSIKFWNPNGAHVRPREDVECQILASTCEAS